VIEERKLEQKGTTRQSRNHNIDAGANTTDIGFALRTLRNTARRSRNQTPASPTSPASERNETSDLTKKQAVVSEKNLPKNERFSGIALHAFSQTELGKRGSPLENSWD
jgi:hypothetical protein